MKIQIALILALLAPFAGADQGFSVFEDPSALSFEPKEIAKPKTLAEEFYNLHLRVTEWENLYSEGELDKDEFDFLIGGAANVVSIMLSNYETLSTSKSEVLEILQGMARKLSDRDIAKPGLFKILRISSDELNSATVQKQKETQDAKKPLFEREFDRVKEIVIETLSAPDSEVSADEKASRMVKALETLKTVTFACLGTTSDTLAVIQRVRTKFLNEDAPRLSPRIWKALRHMLDSAVEIAERDSGTEK